MTQCAQTYFTQVQLGKFAARGTTFGDYNNDGWPDVFLNGNLNSKIALWRNEGLGRFADRTDLIIDGTPAVWHGGGSIFGDYDNDGDLDLFVPLGAWSGNLVLNQLLRNDQGVFHDVAQEVGLSDSMSTDNAIWLDYDRDGYLDLYIGVYGDPTSRNKLYRNQGNGLFVDMTKRAGLDIQLHEEVGGSNGGMIAGDFNDDGWPDLYIAVFNAANRLFLNDGQGGFRDATTQEIAHPGEAFGVTAGDIDNDGDLDIFLSSGGSEVLLHRSQMLLNLGAGQFIDVTEGIGLSELAQVNIELLVR